MVDSGILVDLIQGMINDSKPASDAVSPEQIAIDSLRVELAA
jgi:hypothetical protein